METTLTKEMKGSTMDMLFEKLNIRYFTALNLEKGEDYRPESVYTYEITIRHSEEDDAETLLSEEIEKIENPNPPTKSGQQIYETIADIAYLAGEVGYYSGDSQEDTQTFISLAEQFDEKYKGEVWGTSELDYIETIEDFVAANLEIKKPEPAPEPPKRICLAELSAQVAHYNLLRKTEHPLKMQQAQQVKNAIEEMLQDLPHGNGIDNGMQFMIDESIWNVRGALIFKLDYHHMDEVGNYTEWTQHRILIYPSFQHGFSVSITGSGQNEIKQYLTDLMYEVFE